MTLTELKKSLHEKIDHSTDMEMLEMMDAMVTKSADVFQIPAEHLEGIKQGITDIKNGHFLTLEELEKRYEKWLKD